MNKGMPGVLVRVAWVALAVCLASVAPAGGGQGRLAASAMQTVQLRIVNQSGLPACAVHVARSTGGGWGANRLGGQKLASGRAITVSVASGKHRVRVADCNGAVLLQTTLNLTRNKDLVVTSPLQRRKAPASGTARQLGGGGGGGGGSIRACEFSSAGPEDPEECAVEITDWLLLSFDGLQEDRGSRLVIRAPDGSQQQHNFHNNYFQLFLETGAPLGRYSFVATQDGLQIEGSFDVAPSSNRAVVVTGEPPLLTVHLAGFEPGETFPLNIYRAADIVIIVHNAPGFSIMVYVTSLDEVELDGRGEARVLLPISPTDPVGNYIVIPGTEYDIVNDFYLSTGPETPGLSPLQTCGRATVIGEQALEVLDPNNQTRAGTVRPGQKVALLCVKSNTDDDAIIWTYIRSGSLQGWANSEFLELVEGSVQFHGLLFGD